MRWFLLITFIPLYLYALAFNPNDTKKIEVLSHFDISPSFLNDPYLHDIYVERKRDCILNGFANSSDNADIFIPMLASLIAQSDLPAEFLFIVLAESGLDTLSTSSKGASGLWQFMPKTGKLHGLVINQYVDERRDHIKSTRAAISYLSQLHRQFGRWYLAIIAYNCGDGKLASAIRKAGSNDLYVLANPTKGYIPQESRRYIRTIIALVLLASDQVFLEQIQYDHLIGVASENPIATVYLPEGEEIDNIAAVLDMPKQKLKLLNTHLKHGITPPSQNSYPVYIPQEKLALFEEKYRPKELKKYFVMHKVKSGETLTSLSKRYNIDKTSIMRENIIGVREDFKENYIVRIPMINSFIKNEPQIKDKITPSAPKLYNFDFDKLKIRNPFDPIKTDDKEENKVVH
ncbi:MAG: transglycosylase SLT domain-containing protein [Campylobacterales bacterium]|nr:transglycosylase SLT domain-containing protein [Campylobacterales bacterium]